MNLIQFVMLLTGLLMAFAPWACTRRQARGNPEAEKRTRTMGIWLMVAAGIWLVTAHIL